MSSTPALRIGSRGSPLALAQTRLVRDLLAAADGELSAPGAIEVVVIKTSGDKMLEGPLAEIGGKGLFTKEIDEAMLEARIDLAVHSMKDVPTWLPDGIVLPSLLEREDPRDAFISSRAATIAGLAPGSVVGTASLRRQAQILYRRPDLKVAVLRGNVQTRLGKLADGEVDATLLALAGLKRLGMAGVATAVIAPEEILPAVAQGAIGVTCRAGDRRAHELLAALNHAPTMTRVTAERALLEVLDGSCRTPIAALAEIDSTGALSIRGLVARPDGGALFETTAHGKAEAAEALGRGAGEELLRLAGPGFLESLA